MHQKKNSDVDPWVGNIWLPPVGFGMNAPSPLVETIPKQIEQTIMNHSSHIHSPFAKPLKVMVETAKAQEKRKPCTVVSWTSKYFWNFGFLHFFPFPQVR